MMEQRPMSVLRDELVFQYGSKRLCRMTAQPHGGNRLCRMTLSPIYCHFPRSTLNSACLIIYLLGIFNMNSAALSVTPSVTFVGLDLLVALQSCPLLTHWLSTGIPWSSTARAQAPLSGMSQSRRWRALTASRCGNVTRPLPVLP